MRYIGRHNYHRFLGIRPRGCDAVLQTVVDGTNKIVGNYLDQNPTYFDFYLFFEYISFDRNEVIYTKCFKLIFVADIANPLIGDVGEYKKFVQIHTTQTLPPPTDHDVPVERRRRSTHQNGYRAKN